MSVALYLLNSEGNYIVLFTVQIRSLLKITNDLIDTCYDSRSRTKDTLAEQSVDFRQASRQLDKLRRSLENLFDATETNGAHSLGIGTSVDVVIGLLSRCKEQINKMETMLKQKSGQKEPLSSFNQEAILTGLASSTNALKAVVEGNFQCVRTFARISNADNVHKGPLLKPVLETRRFTSTVSIEQSFSISKFKKS